MGFNLIINYSSSVVLLLDFENSNLMTFIFHMAASGKNR